MPKYIAKQSIGQFMPDDEIKGLNDERIQALLDLGAIEEYKPPEQAKQDDSATQLAELAANADLSERLDVAVATIDGQTQQIKDLTDEKVKSDQRIAELETANADLDKQLKAATAEKAPSKTTAAKAKGDNPS